MSEFSVVALVNAKGGVGKTSLTKILISAALAAGRDVVFFDADTTQNLMSWMERAIEAGNWNDNCKGFACQSVEETVKVLNHLVEIEFDGMVFMDTAGFAQVETLAMVANSNLIVCPTILGADSIKTTFETVEAITEYLGGLDLDVIPAVKVVMTRILPDSKMTKELRTLFDLVASHPLTAKTVITEQNIVSLWDDEGPLLSRFERENASSQNLDRIHAKRVYQLLEQGLNIINELFDAIDANKNTIDGTVSPEKPGLAAPTTAIEDKTDA